MGHENSSSPSQQTVVITGGNSGLGFACARALLTASQPWHVMIACRNPVLADTAVKSLREAAAHGASVEATMMDLASLASVRAFSVELKRRLEAGEIPPLHGIVCSAGMQGAKELTVDGFERTFGVNHLGHYLLVNLLLPLMEKPGRIAIVSSGVHDPAQLDAVPSARVPYPAWNLPAKLAIGELGPGGGNDNAQEDLMRRYSTSKLANMYFTYGLAARLPKGITVNAFDPGLMPGTGLAREHSGLSLFLWKFVLPRMIPLLRLMITRNIHKPEESGAALARLISDPALALTNGKYFEGLKEIRSSVDSYDPGPATELWKESAKLTEISATAL